jgi:hypothetical protein
MQTIQLQLDDSLYKRLVTNNIDIQEEAYRHLEECIEDDGYPAISFEEAKKRVTEAFEDYQENGMKNCVAVDKNFWNERKERLIQNHRKIS